MATKTSTEARAKKPKPQPKPKPTIRNSNTPPAKTDPRPWWRFGLVWMVFGGPAMVVVASFGTLYLAIVHPDPVLNQTALSATQGRQGLSYQPAMQGRNHSATGVLPERAVPRP